MARSENQKLKILYIADFLKNFSDENHPLSVADIISELGRHGIKAERKSIYDDIDALRRYGFDIISTREGRGGYYLASREFELAELKVLVDSVQSSKFITRRKTEALIKKLEGLAGVYDAKQLQRQVYISNRIKRDNESVYYNIDAIHRGISLGRKISFRYFEYSVKKERIFRRSGERYVVSPAALLWEDENYYLVAYDSAVGLVKHYRCDKMMDIAVLDEARECTEKYDALDLSAYSKKVFGMFAGEEKKVRLRFENRLAGPVMDRFGREISIISDGAEHFIINVSVVVSPQFFGWLLGFGTGVMLLGPEETLDEFEGYINAVSEMYGGSAK